MSHLANAPFILPGTATTVVLAHGLGGGTYELQRLGEAIHAACGWTVRAIHLPGHTTPSTFMPSSRHEDWVAAVHAAVDEAVAGAGANEACVHVIGFSTGALAALRVAEERTWPGRLVLLAPLVRVYRPALLPVAAEQVLEALPMLHHVPRRRPPLRDRQTRDDVTRVLPFFTMNLDATRSAVALSERTMAELDRVTVKTLIVQGRNDTVVDPAGATQIAAGLKGPHELLFLEDSDHLVTLDRNRDEVSAAVLRFLSADIPNAT
jgi:carboxylesterase